MNIVITGASGFIATHLRNELEENNNLICLSTTFDHGGFIKLNSGYDDIELKLADKEVDVIIHLASVIPTNFEQASFHEVFMPNVKMMENLRNLCIEKKVKRFIYMSTYGTIEMVDGKERVRDYYTLSKVMGEYICSMMEYKGIQTASLRLPSPYGVNNKTKSVINLFIDKALKNEDINVYGSGKREQNFIYVKDVVNAIKHSINMDNSVSGVYDIVSEKNTSMLELAEAIKSITNSSSNIVVGKCNDPQENYIPIYNYQKAAKDFGYKPTYSIFDGLKDYIEGCFLKDEDSNNS